MEVYLLVLPKGSSRQARSATPGVLCPYVLASFSAKSCLGALLECWGDGKAMGLPQQKQIAQGARAILG
eukprot:1030866-Pelagomonas_calceolata.AAC.6